MLGFRFFLLFACYSLAFLLLHLLKSNMINMGSGLVDGLQGDSYKNLMKNENSIFRIFHV